MMVITTAPPLPSARAYIWTNGWGAPKVSHLSIGGVQNKKRIIVMNDKIPVAMALLRIPRAATTLAFLVSSAIWPDASNPTRVPVVNKKDNIQFQPAGAPVPLSI